MNIIIQDSIEAIRKTYKPSKIKVLFIGESAPFSGKFFYKGDSMCGYTQNAFSRVFQDVGQMTKMEFLNFFKVKGCFLDDLCLSPINHLKNKEKQDICMQSVLLLANRIKEYRPTIIIIVMKKIEKYVKKAINLSELKNVKYYALPFAGNGHQNKYIYELSIILSEIYM